MIRIMAAKELREILLSPKFVVIFAVSTALLLLSTYTGVESYREELREYRLADQLNREDMERGSWNGLLRPGATVLRAPSPLSPVARGVQSVTGRRANIGADLPRTRDSRAMHSPILAVFGELDLAFVVSGILSLFAILLSFDLISGEKERGTLKLLLTGRASRAQILAGKLLGGYTSLVVPLAVPLLLASVYLALTPSLGWGSGEWARFAIIVALSLLYLAVFFVVGVLVSSLTTRSSVSFLVLLLIWVGTVSVAPRTAVLLGSQITPAPSADQMLMEQETISRELSRQRSQRITEAVNQRFRDQGYGQRLAQGENIQRTIQDDVAAVRGQVNNEIDNEIEERHSAIFSDFRARQTAMTNTARGLARLSPTSAFSFATQTLAGTGLESQSLFVEAVQSYREGFLQYVRDQAAAHPEQADGGTSVSIQIGPSGPQFSQQELIHDLDLAALPRFQIPSRSLSRDLRSTLPNLTVLVLILVLSLVGCYAAFRTYDPR